MIRKLILIFIICLGIPLQGRAEEDDKPIDNITVDLREPEYVDGVLTTTQGGIVTGPDIRIQARKIVFTRSEEEGTIQNLLEAEGDVIVELGPHLIVGEKIAYDFVSQTGIVYEGRSSNFPWFFGGREIRLCSDGSYVIYNGFITTTETDRHDWAITSDQTTFKTNRDIIAKQVRFHFARFPVFWIPSFKFNLNSITDIPVRFQFRVAGRQGPRATMIYEIFSRNNFKSFLRFDYSFQRGPGGGLVTEYKRSDKKLYIHTLNYMAKDRSLTSPIVTNRYRFQGLYDHSLCNDKVTIHATYDKFSDRDVPTDYNDQGIELFAGQPTQIQARREETNWIGNFSARWNINPFQTVNQEIPSFQNNWRPFLFGKTGIVNDVAFKASYYDFAYSNNECKTTGYNSTRLAYSHRIWRPFTASVGSIVPDAQALMIYYGNSPTQHEKWVIMGLFGATANTHFYRIYNNKKHVITPYTEYQYFTYPTTTPNHHYIFSIDDGWYRLNQLKCGIKNQLYTRWTNGCISRLLSADLYTNIFFNTPTVGYAVPKAYFDVTFNPAPTVRQFYEFAWNFTERELEHFNIRTEWTVNQFIAFSAEYRHRSAYDWRKVDHTNYILDSFRSIKELEDSIVSDRRDTFLLHLYIKFHPEWAMELASRTGWNRRFQPNYSEYAVNLNGSIQSNWHVKIYYKHRENDDRMGINFSLGMSKPCYRKPDPCVPNLEF